jgi:hypothetical protein
MENNKILFLSVFFMFVLSSCTIRIEGDFLLPESPGPWSEGDDFNSVYDEDGLWISVRNFNLDINKSEFLFVVQMRSHSGLIPFYPENIKIECGDSNHIYNADSELREEYGLR